MKPLPNPIMDEFVREIRENNFSHFTKMFIEERKNILLFFNERINDKPAAEDLTQDVFIQMIKVVKSYQHKKQGTPKGWLYEIAHKICVEYLQQKNECRIEHFEFVPEQVAALPGYTRSDKKMLRKLIKDLAPEFRLVVECRMEEIPFKVISLETGISIGTLVSRMQKAVNHLRKKLPSDLKAA